MKRLSWKYASGKNRRLSWKTYIKRLSWKMDCMRETIKLEKSNLQGSIIIYIYSHKSTLSALIQWFPVVNERLPVKADNE